MDQTQFSKDLSEVLQIEEEKLLPDLVLKDYLDSLSVLSIISVVDEHFGKLISYEQIMACDTFSDLLALVA